MIWTSLSALVLFMGLTQSGQYKIGHLLSIATNYNQVEKTIMLLKHPNTLITSVPCISPLQAEDLRRIPVSSGYGQRFHPILHEYKHHSGIDLPGQMGECVYSTATGLVIAAGESDDIGKYIKIHHAYGFATLYGHLSEIKVRVADSIPIGQVIGLIGSTGRSTGPHLHYRITKNGREQNPLPYCYLYLKWQKVLIRERKK